jgi:hypothetical protein
MITIWAVKIYSIDQPTDPTLIATSGKLGDEFAGDTEHGPPVPH